MADRRLKNFFEYYLLLAFAGCIRLLPRRWALGLGAGLGRISRHILKKRCRTARENLLLAFPDLAPDVLDRTLAGVFRHLGISAVEMLLLDRFRGEEDLRRYITVLGEEHLRGALTHGRGAFILTGHIGFWEIGTFVLPALGIPVDFVAKRMKNPFIDRYFQRLREAAGGRVLDARQGARRIIKSLGENRAVALLIDQHTTPHRAVQVPFFGRPAWTTPIITQIAMKLGVPVVPSFSRRLPGHRYEIEFQEPILFSPSDDPEIVVANTALLTGRIETAVRQNVAQWFWVHRRWRI